MDKSKLMIKHLFFAKLFYARSAMHVEKFTNNLCSANPVLLHKTCRYRSYGKFFPMGRTHEHFPIGKTSESANDVLGIFAHAYTYNNY